MKFLIAISTLLVSHFVLSDKPPPKLPYIDFDSTYENDPNASKILVCLERHYLEYQGTQSRAATPFNLLTPEEKKLLFICSSYTFFKNLKDGVTGKENEFPRRAECQDISDMEEYSLCIIMLHEIDLEEYTMSNSIP